MSALVPLHKLFDAVYGVNLELLNMQVTDGNDPKNIPFISRKEFDNGLVAYVKRVEFIEPNPGHTISVAVSGSVLSSFYQPQPYYSGRDIYYLKPKNSMSVEEMLFYAFCLQANKYRYNYGRGANRTLRNILIPKEMPSEFKKMNISGLDIPKPIAVIRESIELNFNSWEKFSLNDLFHIHKGKRLTKEDMSEGKTPFIGAITSNNGWSHRVGQPAIFKGNVITVNYDGNGVAEAYYQPVPFWALDSVNVLYPRFTLNQYIGLFICTTIKKEKYRFSYGRKWNVTRMQESVIKLPAINNKPDFKFMENYIKSLPYSSAMRKDVNNAIPNDNPIVKKVNTGLTDEELIRKYNTGKQVEFDKALKAMAKTPSPTTLSKQKK